MRYSLAFLPTLFVMAFLTTSADAQAGSATYQAKCLMCHAADGSGNTPAGKSMGALSFHTAALIKASDADLIASTTNGKGKMPAYKSQLSSAQIAAVIGYVRTLQK